MKTTNFFSIIKNKVVLTVALLSFIILGAGTIMAMKAPDKAKAPIGDAKAKHVILNKKKVVQPALFWYSLNSSGQLASQLNTTAQTKNDSMIGGSNPLTDCEDTQSDHCIVGYTTTQTLGIPAPAVAGPDYRVNKD